MSLLLFRRPVYKGIWRVEAVKPNGYCISDRIVAFRLQPDCFAMKLCSGKHVDHLAFCYSFINAESGDG